MKALLLVDLQNDFCKNGALEVKYGDSVIPVANSLIKKFRENNDLIVATKDWHPNSHKSFAINSNGKVGELGILNNLPPVWWPVHCVENTYGSEFHSELDSNNIDNGKLQKTNLDNFLKEKKIDTLYIMGLATDFCVKFTVLDALELGYKVYLIEDGCRGVNLTPSSSKDAIKEMKNKGAIITKSFEI